MKKLSSQPEGQALYTGGGIVWGGSTHGLGVGAAGLLDLTISTLFLLLVDKLLVSQREGRRWVEVDQGVQMNLQGLGIGKSTPVPNKARTHLDRVLVGHLSGIILGS